MAAYLAYRMAVSSGEGFAASLPEILAKVPILK